MIDKKTQLSLSSNKKDQKSGEEREMQSQKRRRGEIKYRRFYNFMFSEEIHEMGIKKIDR